jgi:hypothetical protein
VGAASTTTCRWPSAPRRRCTRGSGPRGRSGSPSASRPRR